ncbi:hypothetical protein EON65_34995, partial [archaeon]
MEKNPKVTIFNSNSKAIKLKPLHVFFCCIDLNKVLPKLAKRINKNSPQKAASVSFNSPPISPS